MFYINRPVVLIDLIFILKNDRPIFWETSFYITCKHLAKKLRYAVFNLLLAELLFMNEILASPRDTNQNLDCIFHCILKYNAYILY